MKIAMSGSTGLIGSRIQELLYRDCEFVPLLQSSIDITDKEQVKKFIDQSDFDVFLHLAAYTDVNGAEKNKELAKSVNVDATQNILDEVTAKGKQMIYISTDFVFDGTNPPYTEESVPNPLGYYAQTKYEGEQIMKDRGMIVRLSYPYRAFFEPKKDFVNALKAHMEKGTELYMVSDMSFTPTFIDDISFGLKHLFTHFSPEIYHLVGSSTLSPYESAMLIAKTYNLDTTHIHETTYDEYFKDKAPRPRYSEIISNKNNFRTMTPFEEGLKIINSNKD